MSLTSRDVEEIERNPVKEPRFTRFFLYVLRMLMKVPPIKSYISKSVGGLHGSIFKCWEAKEFERATKIALFGLDKYRYKKSKFLPFMHHHNWWSLMKYGVDSARHITDEGLRRRLVNHAHEGIEPFEGYDVAHTFLEFSRWMYRAAKYDEAVEYAEIASQADTTWAEPDFILGWYGLVLSKGNAEEHLGRAIQKDQRILFRIANNEICKQYPHIINLLKAKYSASEYTDSPKN